MNQKLYRIMGLPLVRFPLGRKDSINQKKRNIGALGTTTAARLLSVAGVRPDGPILLCGPYAKSFPILRQLLKMSSLPYLIAGVPKDFAHTCLPILPVDWVSDRIPAVLSAGNGRLALCPGGETSLQLVSSISNWKTHLVVLCLGNGLQVDGELLNVLHGLGQYILLINNSLHRSIRLSDECKLTTQELLVSMDYIIVTCAGSAAKDLVAILPTFECEKATNTTDFSVYQNAPQIVSKQYRYQNGGGFRISQSRALESKPILTQEDLTLMQHNNTSFLYNAKQSQIWTAQISR